MIHEEWTRRGRTALPIYIAGRSGSVLSWLKKSSYYGRLAYRSDSRLTLTSNCHRPPCSVSFPSSSRSAISTLLTCRLRARTRRHNTWSVSNVWCVHGRRRDGTRRCARLSPVRVSYPVTLGCKGVLMYGQLERIAITSGEASMLDVVKALGEYLTSEDDGLRTKGASHCSSFSWRARDADRASCGFRSALLQALTS